MKIFVFDILSYSLSGFSGLLNFVILIKSFGFTQQTYCIISFVIHFVATMAVPFIIYQRCRNKINIHKLSRNPYVSSLIHWRYNKKIEHFWVIMYDLIFTAPHLLLQVSYVKFELFGLLYIAITIAILSLATKCVLFAFGFHSLTYIFICLCFFTDILGFVSSLSFINFSNDSPLTTFWFYKLLIGTIPMTFVGCFMLCIGISLQMYDSIKLVLSSKCVALVTAIILFFISLIISMCIIGIGLELGALSYVALLFHIYNYSRFAETHSQFWTELIEWITCVPNSIGNNNNVHKGLNKYERMEFYSVKQKIVCRVNIANYVCAKYTADYRYAVCEAADKMVTEYNKNRDECIGNEDTYTYNPFYECNSFKAIRHKARYDSEFDVYDVNLLWRMRTLYFTAFEEGFKFADATMYSHNKFEKYCVGYSFMGCTIFALFATVPLYLLSRFATLFYPLIGLIYSLNSFDQSIYGWFQLIYSISYTLLILIIIFLFVKYVMAMEYVLYHFVCLELEVKLRNFPDMCGDIIEEMEYQYEQILGKHSRDVIIPQIFGDNLGSLILSFCSNHHDLFEKSEIVVELHDYSENNAVSIRL